MAGIDFFLPNSCEKNLFDEVKLSRRFQRALELVRFETANKDETKFTKDIEIDEILFNVEYEEQKKKILQQCFYEWKSMVDIRRSKEMKAKIFHNFGMQEKCLKRWRKRVSDLKRQREEAALRRQKEHERLNLMKADLHFETATIRHYFEMWRGYSQLMAKKRELRCLDAQRKHSRDRINVFLKHLHNAAKKEDSEVMARHKKGHKQISPVMVPPKEPAIPKDAIKGKHSPISKNLKNFNLMMNPHHDRSRHSANQGPKISPRKVNFKNASIPLESEKSPLEDILHEYDEASRKHLSLQEHTDFMKRATDRQKAALKEIKDLVKLKRQMEAGHAMTEAKMYKDLIFDTDQYVCQDSGESREKSPFEFRAGDVLQIRMQAQMKDRDFASKLHQTETDSFARKSQIHFGNRSKTPIRNIIVPIEVGQPGEFDESDFKFFSKTKAFKDAQRLKELTPEENFLLRMKLRQKERERRRNEMRKFHQLRAEENRMRKAEELALRERQEKEDRLKKKQELKLLKKREKEKEAEREKEMERQVTLQQVAITWERKNRLERSFQKWWKVVRDRRLKNYLAEKMSRDKILKNGFVQWRDFKQSEKFRKEFMADRVCHRQLLAKTFIAWKNRVLYSRLQNQTAQDFYDFRIVLHTFEEWKQLTRSTVLRSCKLHRSAVLFHKYKTLRHYLERWRRFVKAKDIVSEREKIRMELARKVAIEVEDYSPGRL